MAVEQQIERERAVRNHSPCYDSVAITVCCVWKRNYERILLLKAVVLCIALTLCSRTQYVHGVRLKIYELYVHSQLLCVSVERNTRFIIQRIGYTVESILFKAFSFNNKHSPHKRNTHTHRYTPQPPHPPSQIFNRKFNEFIVI